MTINADTIVKFKDGETAETDEVLTNFSFALSQTLFLSEDASRTTSDGEKYFTADIFTGLDYTNSICFKKDNNDYIAFCNITDDCDDGSVDGNIWSTTLAPNGTTATVTEESTGATGYLKVYADNTGNVSSSPRATARADQSNALDLKAADCEILINFEMATGSQVGGTTTLMLTDGSVDVNIIQKTSSQSFTRDTIRLVIDVSGENCYLYDGGMADTTSSTIDISSLTGSNWYLKFDSYAGSGSINNSTIKVYSVGYINGSATSSTYRSTAQTITSADNGIYNREATVLSKTTVDSISFDNASNFATTTRRTLNEGTAGTQLILRLVGTHETSLSVGSSDRNIDYLSGNLNFLYS